MAHKVFKIVIAILGTAVLPALVYFVFFLFNLLKIQNFYETLDPTIIIIIYILSAIISCILFILLAPAIIALYEKTLKLIIKNISDMPSADLIAGTLGVIISLVLAYLITSIYRNILPSWAQVFTNAIVYLIFGTLGWSVAAKKRLDITVALTKKTKQAKLPTDISAKVLDTSVIIDGRIYDICKTGILEGRLIVPVFVLRELQHIADSADSLKRNRGRRGLDILKKLQKELKGQVFVVDTDYDDIQEVDAKLLRLTQDLKGIVVTNDYNLNKVAQVQNVKVLNINELANAVKPVALPGEEMVVQVVKAGKESGQGLAYLDDGTMIVIENGKKCVGERIEVLVTSVLQTAAGRMIFAKTK